MKRTQSPAATPSPVQNQALNLSGQQQQLQQGQINQASQNIGAAGSTISSTTPTLNQYQGVDPSQTPLGKSLTASLTSSTSNAYKNAQANARRSALQMGLQNQPVEAGNEAALGAKEAEALAKIPGQVTQDVAPLQLQATGLTQQNAALQNALAGTSLNAARVYNPLGYFGEGAGLESQRQGALNEQYLQSQAQKSALLQGLIKAGLSFVPGQYA